ncbi:hypothetical protein ACHAWF_006060 [Thalassiosira exigua]
MRGSQLVAAVAALSAAGVVSASGRKVRARERKTLKKYKKGDNTVMDEEDVAFWTRLLNGGGGDRGKGTDSGAGSLPFVPRPPSPTPPDLVTPNPTDIVVTPNPTDQGPGVITPMPTERVVPVPPTPTPPAPTPPAVTCPPIDVCTAPDPSDFQDECSTVGQPCDNANVGEYCCRDGCPRNYCTAKVLPA